MTEQESNDILAGLANERATLKREVTLLECKVQSVQAKLSGLQDAIREWNDCPAQRLVNHEDLAALAKAIPELPDTFSELCDKRQKKAACEQKLRELNVLD